MEKIDVEQQLKEASEQVEMRDFSEIWGEIKGDIENSTPAKAVKKKKPKWIYSLASIAACLVLFCAVGLPIILTNPKEEIVFFWDELTQEKVLEEEFLTGVENSSLDTVNLRRYKSQENTYLLKTEDGIVKGGRIIFLDDENSPLFYVELTFTSTDVKNGEVIEYNKTYSVNGANIEYKLAGDNTGLCYAKGTFNSVVYYFDITPASADTDVTTFFDSFFVSNSN